MPVNKDNHPSASTVTMCPTKEEDKKKKKKTKAKKKKIICVGEVNHDQTSNVSLTLHPSACTVELN